MSDVLAIAMGADHAGVGLKDKLADYLRAKGVEVLDLGTHGSDSVDYPDFAHAVAEAVASGKARLGILVCGTGLGVSMAANKHDGIRAAAVSEAFSAEMARLHNDANVLCLGARVIGEGVAQQCVDRFLSAEFEGGRHQRRVDKIAAPPAVKS